MSKRFISTATVVAALIATVLAPAISPAREIVRPSAILGAQPINVSVNFNIQMPLDSLDEAAIIEAQTSGRALIYRLARNECEVLLAEIAETCRLTGLNASTQIPQPRNMNPIYINLSGNAQFAISLKAENAE